MLECQVCKNHPDRLAERIAHEVLDWIAEKEGYARVIHARPNSLRDREGKDFVLVPKRAGLFIQIKAFRILKSLLLKMKMQRLKAGAKLRKGRFEQLDTSDKLKQFMRRILRDSQKSRLCSNDSKYRLHFNKLSKNIKLNELLDSDCGYDKLLAIYGKIEAYLNLFEKELRHAEIHQEVKIFLIVDTTGGCGYKRQVEILKKEWLPIIREEARKLNS